MNGRPSWSWLVSVNLVLLHTSHDLSWTFKMTKRGCMALPSPRDHKNTKWSKTSFVFPVQSLYKISQPWNIDKNKCWRENCCWIIRECCRNTFFGPQHSPNYSFYHQESAANLHFYLDFSSFFPSPLQIQMLQLVSLIAISSGNKEEHHRIFKVCIVVLNTLFLKKNIN